MQLKMQEILGYTVFYDTVAKQKLPLKTSYKLAKFSKAVETELQFYQEKLRKIIFDYALLDEQGEPILLEDGSGVKLRPGVDKECNEAMEELQNIEVNIPDFNLTLDELESLELTLVEMNYILPFITE